MSFSVPKTILLGLALLLIAENGVQVQSRPCERDMDRLVFEIVPGCQYDVGPRYFCTNVAQRCESRTEWGPYLLTRRLIKHCLPIHYSIVSSSVTGAMIATQCPHIDYQGPPIKYAYVSAILCGCLHPHGNNFTDYVGW